MSIKRCINSKGCTTREYWSGQKTVDRNPKWVEIHQVLKEASVKELGA